MGQALYRKYRSKNLGEIAGQTHITSTLARAIEQDKISHAYLFTGPRGVGKTSIARILAHQINDLPYTDESIHLDIIEIDAASNRRIDEIRDLRDKVHIAPTSAKYKVYIIDEVHMLTREAFNALLKTLEEPPAHVVFILATTELHKLPETIISRTQRFTFKPIDDKVAADHLKSIAKSEKIAIDDEAIELLARHGRGSFRDSISLLDQVAHSNDTVTADDVRNLLGLASEEHVLQTIQSVQTGSSADVAGAIQAFVDDGTSPTQAAKQLSAHVRTMIISGQGNDVLLDLLADLLAISQSPEPAAALEIALFKAHLALTPGNNVLPASESAAKPTAHKPSVSKKVETEADKPTRTTEAAKPVTVDKPATGELADWWSEVLGAIKQDNNTLYGILRMAEPRVDGKTLHLTFGFAFHKKKVANSETQAKIQAAIKQVTGKNYKIEPLLGSVDTSPEPAKPAIKKSPKAEKPQNDELESITNVFGGGEVLES